MEDTQSMGVGQAIAVRRNPGAQSQTFNPKKSASLLKVVWRDTIPKVAVGFTSLENTMKTLIAEQRAKGRELILMYIPYQSEIDPEYAKKQVRRAGGRLESFDFGMLATFLGEFAQSQPVTFVDLAEVIRQRGKKPGRYYYLYDGHFTPAGHDLAAQALAEAIQQIANESGAPERAMDLEGNAPQES